MVLKMEKLDLNLNPVWPKLFGPKRYGPSEFIGQQ